MLPIKVLPEGAHFVADKSFANYIESNLTQIGSAPVTITEISRENLAQREEKVKIISATVADLRLDAVAAAGYGVSRSRMADEIKSLNVRVNWKEAKKPSQSVNEGDVISLPQPRACRSCRNTRHNQKGTHEHYFKTLYLMLEERGRCLHLSI